jgi:hypothetical protein
MSISFRIIGDAALLRKLQHPSWAAGPAGEFLDRWRFFVEGRAKGLAPFWRGGLRRSITSERDHGFFPTWARAGTNLFYSIFVHEGTRPHWPPIAAIAPWATAHGISPFQAAKGIAAHGTKGRPFLKDAAEESVGKIGGWLNAMAGAMEAQAAD